MQLRMAISNLGNPPKQNNVSYLATFLFLFQSSKMLSTKIATTSFAEITHLATKQTKQLYMLKRRM